MAELPDKSLASVAAPNFTPGLESLDLLAIADPEKDAVDGPWQKVADGVETTNGHPSRLALPVDPQGDYVLSLKFTRRAGNCSLYLILPLPDDRQATAIFGGWPGRGKISGLAIVDGTKADDLRLHVASNGSGSRGFAIQTGRTYQIVVQVTTRDSEIHIVGAVDGETVIQWSGQVAQLSQPEDWQLRPGDRLALSANMARGWSMIFHEAKMQMLNGAAKLLRQPPDGVKLPGFVTLPKPPAPTDWLDVLALTDPQHDTFQGTWRKTSHGVVAETDAKAPNAQLAPPIDVVGDYLLRFQFKRLAGNDSVNLILPLPDNRQVHAVLSGWPGIDGVGTSRSALLTVSGEGVRGSNPTVNNTFQIETGRTYEVIVRVVSHPPDVELSIVVDGCARHFLFGSRFRIISHARLCAFGRQPGCALGSYASNVQFQNAQLQMTTGRANLLRPVPPGMQLPTFVALPDESKRNEWLDLLPLLSTAQDIRSGTWTIQDGTVQYAGNASLGILEFPLVPRGSYRWQLEFRGIGNGQGVSVVLPVGERRVRLALDSYGGKIERAGLTRSMGIRPQTLPTPLPPTNLGSSTTNGTRSMAKCASTARTQRFPLPLMERNRHVGAAK